MERGFSWQVKIAIFAGFGPLDAGGSKGWDALHSLFGALEHRLDSKVGQLKWPRMIIMYWESQFLHKWFNGHFPNC
jgi:hypothetical protein